jgi:hypothetical protein
VLIRDNILIVVIVVVKLQMITGVDLESVLCRRQRLALQDSRGSRDAM